MIYTMQDIPDGAVDAMETFGQLSPLMAGMLVLLVVALVILAWVISRGRAENTAAKSSAQVNAGLTTILGQLAATLQGTNDQQRQSTGIMTAISERMSDVAIELRAINADVTRSANAAEDARVASEATREAVTRVLPETIANKVATAVKPLTDRIDSLTQTVETLSQAVRQSGLDASLCREMAVILEQSRDTLAATALTMAALMPSKEPVHPENLKESSHA